MGLWCRCIHNLWKHKLNSECYCLKTKLMNFQTLIQHNKYIFDCVFDNSLAGVLGYWDDINCFQNFCCRLRWWSRDRMPRNIAGVFPSWFSNLSAIQVQVICNQYTSWEGRKLFLISLLVLEHLRKWPITWLTAFATYSFYLSFPPSRPLSANCSAFCFLSAGFTSRWSSYTSTQKAPLMRLVKLYQIFKNKPTVFKQSVETYS